MSPRNFNLHCFAVNIHLRCRFICTTQHTSYNTAIYYDVVVIVFYIFNLKLIVIIIEV